jgi:dihydroneopterin aldolase
MSDRIILSGIQFYAWGGVTEQERAIGQSYRLDLQLVTDLTVAGEKDAIEDTVHYGQVHDLAVRSVRAASFKLLESAASRIAAEVLREFPVESVTVRLAKLHPPIDGVVAEAAVEITRTHGPVSGSTSG